MTKTSINIQPVKGNSEAHNLRKTKLDYAFPQNKHKNQSVVLEEIRPTLSRIEKCIKEKTGRSMQKKATPIREGVVVLGKKSAKDEMDKLKFMCEKIEQKFGIKTMQIHIHEDEGHKDRKTGELKQNRHAHVVFNWVNEDNGRSHKLKKQDMAQMQTIVAESLGLERGQSSDKKHLHSIEFKAQAKAKEVEQMESQRKEAKRAYLAMRTKHGAVNYTFEFAKGISESFKRLGGVHEANKLRILFGGEINELRGKNTELKDIISKTVSLDQYNNLHRQYQQIESNLERVKGDLKQSQGKYTNTLDVLKEITLNGNKSLFEEVKQQFKEREQKQQMKSKGFGQSL
jgi:hypothetical protein